MKDMLLDMLLGLLLAAAISMVFVPDWTEDVVIDVYKAVTRTFTN